MAGYLVVQLATPAEAGRMPLAWCKVLDMSYDFSFRI